MYRNTMSKLDYSVKTILFTIIATTCFKASSLFRPLFGGVKDVLCFVFLAVFCCFAGLALTWRNRTNWNVWIHTAAPLAVWLVASNFGDFHVVTVLMAAFFSLVYLIFLRLGRQKNVEHLTWVQRRILSLRRLRLALGVGIFALLVSLSVDAWYPAPAAEPAQFETRQMTTLAENIETVAKLDYDTWSTLRRTQKLAVLQTIADIEADAFGLPERLKVEPAKLEGNVMGCYLNSRKRIRIDTTVLDNGSSWLNLNILLHECRHAYQFQLVELYSKADEAQKQLFIFKMDTDVRELKACFEDYVDGSEDFEQYNGQLCEKDARRYAEYCTPQYYNAIQEYLDGA